MKKEENEITKDIVPDYYGHRQRLRERFLADLGRSMPEYELLELLLMYALPRRDVKPLAKQLIREYKSLASIIATHPMELEKSKGIGINIAILCGIVHACINKVCWENLENTEVPILTDKKRVAEYCRSRIAYAGEEQLLVIYLDYHGNFMRDSIEQSGTVNAVPINPSSIARKALMCNASGIIIAHNHPTGDVFPSKADIRMTQELKEALNAVKVTLHDHIIISKSKYYSFVEHLPFMSQ